MTPDEQRAEYERNVGGSALLRQQNWAAVTACPYCWAQPGEEHVSICPQAPPPEEVAIQTEALF